MKFLIYLIFQEKSHLYNVLNRNSIIYKLLTHKFMSFRLIILLFISFAFSGCHHPYILSKNRIIEISFHLNKITEIHPSYQTAIWLETPAGKYVETEYVSEWLSFGGFSLPEICPDWSGKANWNHATVEKIDAVTGATPSTGDVHFKFHCSKKTIPKGEYIYMIEVHLIEGFNELYKGKIEIGGKKNESQASVICLPERFLQKGNILSQVKVKVH